MLEVKELLNDCKSLDDYISLIESLKRTLTSKELQIEELSMRLASNEGVIQHTRDVATEWQDKADHYKKLYESTIEQH